MNGLELARALAAAQGIPEYKAKEAVRIIKTQIADTLRAGGSVALEGLGTFEVKQLAAREYPNPKNKGQVIKAQPRVMMAFKSAKGLFNNPPSVIEAKPVKPVWAGHVWVVGVQDFAGLQGVDMTTYTAATRGRVDAAQALPNSLTVAAVTLDQVAALSLVEVDIQGARVTRGTGGEARLSVSLWGMVGGVMQEQAAMFVDVGADSAQSGAMYYWSVSARLQATATGTALVWGLEWPGQVRPQAVKQSLVWPDRLTAVQVRVGYVPALAALDLPGLADDTKTHWAEVRAGVVSLVEV